MMDILISVNFKCLVLSAGVREINNFIMMSKFCIWSRPYRGFTYFSYRNKSCSISSSNKKALFYLSHVNRFISRPIHAGVSSYVKLYVEGENDYAHKIMETLGDTYSIKKNSGKVILDDAKVLCSPEKLTSILDNVEWKDQPTTKILDTFDSLSNCALNSDMKLSSSKFDNFVDKLTDSLMILNASELEAVFENLQKWPETTSVRSRNFIEVWTALDDVLTTRILDFDTKTQLKFADHIYHLHLSGKFDYMSELTKRCARKYKHLTPQQLVQTLFYVSACRRAPLDMINFEVLLIEYYDQLTIDEIAIICMGFFKSKSSFRSPDLVNKILHSVTKEADKINEISLCAILKIIKYSLKHSTPSLQNMFNALTVQVPRLSFLCCVHVALAGTTVLKFHEDSLMAIAQKFLENPSCVRLKDLERMVFTYALFTYNPPTDVDVFDLVVKELRSPAREQEILRHGTCFVNCLAFLAMINIFPKDLIDKSMEKEFIRMSYTFHRSQYGKSLLSLNHSVAIECNDYNGNRLSADLCMRLAKQLNNYIPDIDKPYKLSFVDQAMVNVMAVLENMRGGKDYVVGTHILPHFSLGDIVVCDDSNEKPVKVKKYFTEDKYGSIQRAPISNCKWFAISIGPRTLIPGEDFAYGPRVMKERQLKKIGYIPILILSDHWTKIKNEDDKIKYLTDALKSAQLQKI